MSTAMKRVLTQLDSSGKTTTGTEVVESVLHRSLPWIVVLFATLMGTISQYPGLVNPYVVNGDVPQHVFWAQQFVDEDLFKDDVLTEFAKAIQPYGFVFVYRLASFVMDPLITSKILPIALFIVSALYLFKLVQFISGTLSGIFAALLFVTMPVFLSSMAGGTPRTFAYPLMIIFLYYLIKEDHLKASLLLVLQALFYPLVLLISLCTYALTFLKIEPFKVSLDFQRFKLTCFILASVIGVALAAAKYLPGGSPSQSISAMTKSQMGNAPEYLVNGRFQIVPTPPLTETMLRVSTRPFIGYIADSYLYLAIREFRPAFATLQIGTYIMLACMLLVGLFLVYEFRKGKLWIRRELIYVLVAAVIMYKLADLFLFKLYLPDRYLIYSVPLIVLIIISVTLGRLIAHVKNRTVRTGLTLGMIVFFLISFHMNGVGLVDKSDGKNLYKFLHTLPKNALIAAPPFLADYIPTFSKRKVFINYELTHAWTAGYWAITKSRTSDFFRAYYAADQKVISDFCLKHKIDYVVVDKRDFLPDHLANGKIYFEPFDSEVRSYALKQPRFALLRISETDKLFVDGDLFVVKATALIGS